MELTTNIIGSFREIRPETSVQQTMLKKHFQKLQREFTKVEGVIAMEAVSLKDH